MIYQTLITQYLNWLYSVCQNVDSMTNVPATVQAGYVATHREGTAGVDIALNSNNAVQQVSSTQVSNELASFLSSRGISSKLNTTISSSGLLNIWNQLAVFTATKVRTVIGYDGSYCTAYFPNQTTYQQLTATDSSLIQARDVNDLVTSLNALVKYQNATRLTYTISAVSSSSCSSSCSSSSSTSSSSCSLFIAYIKL